MAMTRAQWETTNRARELVLGVLRDSPNDAMTAGEVYAAIVDAELNSSMQTAVILKFAAADGLVIRETGHTAREVLWRISEAGKSWKPEPYNWKKSRPEKLKAKAPAVSAQGPIQPAKASKPAKDHPYNVTPAVAKTARTAPVTRPLPIHLETKTYADLRQEASDYLQLKAAFDQLKEDYRLLKEGTVHLLTIADEHASTGDDLGCSPVWKTACRIRPVFGLEKTYA